MNKLEDEHAETALEQYALDWLNEEAEDRDDGVEGVYSDLMQGGCQSGIVGDLIYYHDTLKFYKEHQTDIGKLLAETLEGIGCGGPAELFGDKWEKEDPMAVYQLNQNLLAWFGFEEAARLVAGRAGIEA